MKISEASIWDRLYSIQMTLSATGSQILMFRNQILLANRRLTVCVLVRILQQQETLL